MRHGIVENHLTLAMKTIMQSWVSKLGRINRLRASFHIRVHATLFSIKFTNQRTTHPNVKKRQRFFLQLYKDSRQGQGNSKLQSSEQYFMSSQKHDAFRIRNA